MNGGWIIFWNEVFLIGGFTIGIIAGLHVGYDRGRRGMAFWTGRPPAAPEFLAEKILDGKLYSTRAAQIVGHHGSRFLYMTASGEFFTVVDYSPSMCVGGMEFQRLEKARARAWVLAELPAREGRAVLEEWFGERIELA